MSSRIVRGEACSQATSGPWLHGRGPSPSSQAGAPAHPGAGDNDSSESERQQEDKARQSHDAGFRAGQEAAELSARQQVEAAGLRAARSIAEAAGHRDRIRREAERDVVRLAIEIARRILHREISADPEALSGLVRTALDKINAREVQRIRVDAQHSVAVERALDSIGLPQRVEIIADPAIEPGGFVIETVRGGFDASINTQLDEIDRGFTDLIERRRR